MQKRSRSSQEWFSIWNEIISLEDSLSRVRLSEISGASVQVIKSLQKDWMDQNHVKWNGQYFYIYIYSLTPIEQERLK